MWLLARTDNKDYHPPGSPFSGPERPSTGLYGPFLDAIRLRVGDARLSTGVAVHAQGRGRLDRDEDLRTKVSPQARESSAVSATSWLLYAWDKRGQIVVRTWLITLSASFAVVLGLRYEHGSLRDDSG